MGLCSSCCGNSADDIFENEQNDKTNLLGNPVGEGSRSTRSVTVSHQSISKQPSDDQQEKLNRILQKTANSYIDVPALNSPVDQTTDKSKDYESKIQSVLRNRVYTEHNSLLEDTPHVERALSGSPLSEEDCKMMKDINASILAAIQSMEVTSSEELVIPFTAPKNSQ